MKVLHNSNPPKHHFEMTAVKQREEYLMGLRMIPPCVINISYNSI
jgi:hypothetical protein